MLSTACETMTLPARLTRELPANDTRQTYLRAKLSQKDGEYWADAFDAQDSSMLSVLAQANALIVRMPGAAATKAGERVDVIPLDGH
jgi:molybdopterin molybdotransferase